MTAALRLAISLVLSLLMWLPTVPGALTANEDPARLGMRYLLALLVARVGVGIVFRIVSSYATPEPDAEEEVKEELPAAAPPEGDQYSPDSPGRRRDDVNPVAEATDQERLDNALDEVEETAVLAH